MGLEDDYDGSFGGEFEEGHWAWDEATESLVFISDRPPEEVDNIPLPLKAPTGTIEFRDDIDLLEQLRFRKRYMRKLRPGQADVVTVQDVKDLALYTAPLMIMSPVLIDMLHLPTTERFIRALIFYCQYYLQTADVMTERVLELQTKVRTPQSQIVEDTYRENLCDLRALVAKEYCTMIIGGADTKKFHHLGPKKKCQSLSDKDARLYETLIRMCIQIVWLALGRRSFHQIELEVNRIFKSDTFNSVEHTMKTDFINKMSSFEQNVLLGYCVRHDRQLNTRSPLMNELFCGRPIDYRMMGLGVIKYPVLNQRLLYMWLAITGPEEELINLGVTCGILGYPRSYFDTMLRVLSTITSDDNSKSKISSKGSVGSGGSQTIPSQGSARKSRVSTSTADAGLPKCVYGDIVLPEKESTEQEFPPSFPEESEAARRCNEKQRRLWHNRLQKMLNPATARRSTVGTLKST